MNIRHFLINLKERPDRLENAIRQLSKINVTPIILQATRPLDKGLFSSIGERGCNESHRAVWDKISKLDDPDGLSIVCEDDLLFRDNYFKYFDSFVKLFVDSDYNCMYFYDSMVDDLNVVSLRPTKTYGNHYYMIKNKHIDKFVALATDPIIGPSDILIIYEGPKYGILNCSTSKTLVQQNRSFQTDIITSGVCRNQTFTSNFQDTDNKNFDFRFVGDWKYTNRSKSKIYNLGSGGLVNNDIKNRWFVKNNYLFVYTVNTLCWDKFTIDNSKVLKGVSWDNSESSFERVKEVKKAKKLDVNITKLCNLSCTGCNSFVPLYKEKDSYSEYRIIDDLKILSRYYHYEAINLVGGEPLLHPRIKDIIKQIKDINIGDIITITSNGLLLNSIDDELIGLLDGVIVNQYPKTPNINGFVDRLKEKQKYVHIDTITTINKPYASVDKTLDQMKHNFKFCDYNKSDMHVFYDGYLFKCCLGYHINRLQGKRFSDGVKIDSIGFEEKFKVYLNSIEPLLACRNCNSGKVKEPWSETSDLVLWKKLNSLKF
jgi:GR25 family glycosyltransferase involved in LPS biosynthesis